MKIVRVVMFVPMVALGAACAVSMAAGLLGLVAVAKAYSALDHG